MSHAAAGQDAEWDSTANFGRDRIVGHTEVRNQLQSLGKNASADRPRAFGICKAICTVYPEDWYPKLNQNSPRLNGARTGFSRSLFGHDGTGALWGNVAEFRRH